MTTFNDDEQIIQAIKNRAEAGRKRAIRYNVLLSLFFCLFIAGLVVMIYLYTELQKSEANAIKSETKAIIAEAEADSVRRTVKIKADSIWVMQDSIAKLIEKGNCGEAKKIAVGIIKGSNSDTAEFYAKKGYEALDKGQLDSALKYFDKSEKAYNGYKTSYEIYFLLWKNRKNFDDLDVKSDILKLVHDKYWSNDTANISTKANIKQMP